MLVCDVCPVVASGASAVEMRANARLQATRYVAPNSIFWDAHQRDHKAFEARLAAEQFAAAEHAKAAQQPRPVA